MIKFKEGCDSFISWYYRKMIALPILSLNDRHLVMNLLAVLDFPYLEFVFLLFV